MNGRSVLFVNCPTGGQNFFTIQTQVDNQTPYLILGQINVGPNAVQCITLSRFGRLDFTHNSAYFIIRTMNNTPTANTTSTNTLTPTAPKTPTKTTTPTPANQFNTFTPIINR